MIHTPTSDSGSGDSDHHFAPPTPPNPTDYHHARPPRLTNVTKTVRKVDSASIAAYQAQQAIDPRLVLIVGVCSAGKSTLAANLKEKGYRVRTCAQEHSYVPHLWQLSKPD